MELEVDSTGLFARPLSPHAMDVLTAVRGVRKIMQASSRNSETDVDIAILSWNRPDETIEAVASALSQTGVARKVLIVDQGSEASNLARLRAYCDNKPDVVLKCLPANVGVAEGRNVAIALGSAPFIIGLDNDAVFTDDGVAARAVQRMRAEPRLGIIAFRILDFDTREETHWDYPESYRNAPVDSFETTRFLGGGQAIRRDAFEAVGGYDAALFFIGEERDISWRILNAGYRIKWFRDLGILHHEDASQKVTWTHRRYYFTVRNTLYINYKFGMAWWRLARATAAFWVRGVSNGLLGAAVQGTLASVGMIWRFVRLSPNKAPYRLSADVRRYIRETDQEGRRTLVQRLRRMFARLPH